MKVFKSISFGNFKFITSFTLIPQSKFCSKYPISNSVIGKDKNNQIIFQELHSFESLQAQLGYSNTKKSTENDPFHFFINGYENQIAYVDLGPRQSVISESCKHVFATAGVNIESSVGGFGNGIVRLFSGSTFFMVNYTFESDIGKGRVAFAHSIPSKILPIRLADYGGSILCKKGSFICGDSNIKIEVAASKSWKTGFFGSQGLLLQKLSGGELVLIGGGGSLVRYDLRPDEIIKVSPSCVLAFSESVDYEVEFVGSNVFGLGGLFFTIFKGPGTVYLQSMNFDNLISQIKSRIPSRSNSSSSSSSSNDK